MNVTFHGAAQTVTGSRHLISINGHRLLLDCGLFQGRRKEAWKRNREFPFDPASIDAVILSHAHIDHSGNLPNLVRHGFKGPVHATHATAHLSDIMLRDSGHIHESDAAFLNKKLARRGQPLIEPLYTVEHAQMATKQLVGQAYDEPFEVVPGVVARLVEVGHILGSAAIELNLQENGRHVRLMFSGDIGRFDMPIIRDPILPQDIDYLIMECTYGDRTHNSPEEAYEETQEVVCNTLRNGGKVIIPSFAVGRTQTLIYFLHRMIDEGRIPRVPVFVDSPLAINVTDIFRAHPECYDQEMHEFMNADPHGSALGFDLLQYTRSVQESKAINEVNGPVVIISASGMAEVGRILHHLRNNIDDPRNTILITSWMAPHTLGRRLVEGNKVVKIFGEKHDVRARVTSINGLSSHADQNHLLAYAMASRQSLREVFLVHGENEAANALRKNIIAAGIERVAYPPPGTVVEL
jgi:metallo-beta-lactamase family protein